jgi:hypothetical protein
VDCRPDNTPSPHTQRGLPRILNKIGSRDCGRDMGRIPIGEKEIEE